MANTYSNIIAPSDGVRRFLCKTSVLMAGIISAVYCFCAFRMNMIESGALGATLRSNMLCAAYIMLPLGFITAAVFARIRAMGLAFSMISLLVSCFASFMLLLNSFASLLREQRLLGVSGSLLEFLTFAAFFALFVGLVMSCMDFRIVPVIGTAGAASALLALIVTSVRTVLSFSALAFASKPEFDWNNLRELVDTDKLRYHASWVFRSVLRGDGNSLHAMFVWRYYERIAACVFYAVLLMIFLKYQKEMKAFNKLLRHASEYVDIPTARIYRNIFGSGARNDAEPDAQPPISRRKSAGGTLRGRLMNLANMTRAKEQGLDISDLADEYDAQRAADYEDYGIEEEEELTEEERYIRDNRQMAELRGNARDGQRPRREDSFGEDRGRERPGSEDRFGEDRRGQRPRREDGFGENRRGQRSRREDGFGEDHGEQRHRRNGNSGADRQRPPREPERELTAQEKYLMEERMKRQRNRHYPDPNRTDGTSRRDAGNGGSNRYR